MWEAVISHGLRSQPNLRTSTLEPGDNVLDTVTHNPIPPPAVFEVLPATAIHEQVFRLLCSSCGKLILESEAMVSRASSPDVIYIKCVGCGEAEDRARGARLVDREVRCRCGRLVAGFVDPGADTIARCKKCDPPERQYPGDTFPPKDRILGKNGKRGAAAVMGKRSMQGQDYAYYDEWRDARNEEIKDLKDIYSPGFVKQAQQTIDEMSVREIQKRWGIGCYESTRQGKIGVLRLKPIDLETPLQLPPREIVHQMGRKCEHGNWKHRDDREKSRHCSACYSNRFHKRRAKIADAEPRQETKAKSELEKTLRRLIEMDVTEEFGVIPLDPETVVSQELA
jgi:hypothetical protein